MKRRRGEDPLHGSVNDVIERMTEWEDECDGKFTFEVDITTGLDFVYLEIRNIEEVRVAKLLKVTREVPNIISCRCDFSEQAICFRFESVSKRMHVAADNMHEANESAIAEEVKLLSHMAGDETEQDIRLIARYIVSIKRHAGLLQRSSMRINISSSPGMITITVKNLTQLNADLLEAVNAVSCDNDEIDILFSPVDSQCVRIRMNKSKRIVNL